MMKRSAMALIVVLALAGSMTTAAQRGQGNKPAARADVETKPAPALAVGDVINLNTASATDIATLPGIGPKTAELIVQYRQKNGSFKKVEEIMNVKGVGEKTFLKLKSRLTVGAAK
jgi:competence protein ComEA